MERKINWTSGRLDEIELVYEKALAGEGTAGALEELEEQALSEARACCGALKTKGGPLTPEEFDRFTPVQREEAICLLGGLGLSELKADPAEGAITVRFSPVIQSVLGCTVFQLLNRLEKLDGGFHLLVSDRAKLNLLVPLGGKKGLFRWEMLILELYPWLSVHESSSREPAVPLSAEGALTLPETRTPPPPAAAPKKRPFWKRLFGQRSAAPGPSVRP